MKRFTPNQNSSLSGTFVGQLFNSALSSPSSFIMNLTLNNNSTPSAFGAIQYTSESGEKFIHIIAGEWTESTKELSLNEYSVASPGVQSQIEGSLTLNPQGLAVIRGKYQHKHGDSGAFVCQEEEFNEDVHITGIFEGASMPDKSQRSYIPTNPIVWSLTVLLQKGEDEQKKSKEEGESSTSTSSATPTASVSKDICVVFGAGYFVDSGDVDGKPVLMYRMEGTWDKTSTELKLTKMYEFAEETAGYEIGYVGNMAKQEQGNGPWKLDGKWKNEKGGSFGEFVCKQQPDARRNAKK